MKGRGSMKANTKRYLWGLGLTILGGAALADHITDGVGSFPISAVVFGIGLILIVWSYGHE
jgi:hypothetical protein